MSSVQFSRETGEGESEELMENRAGGGGEGVSRSREGMNAAPVPSPMSQTRPG